MDKRKILVIDPDEKEVSYIKNNLELLGYVIESRPRLTRGLRALNDDFAVILLDKTSSQGAEIDPLREIKSYHPDAFVIMMGSGGVASQGAKISVCLSLSDAVKSGAYYCLERPLDMDALKTVVDRAFMEKAMRQELQKLKFDSETPHIVCESPRMMKTMKALAELSENDAPVLISGEKGAGKGYLAKFIHMKSRRRGNLFAKISVDSVSSEVFEAETLGLISDRGLGGGTLYINEAALLNAEIETEVLKLLDNPQINVRMICGTAVADAENRLLGALKGSEIKIPPLRERREDIVPLAMHFLRESEKWFETSKRFSKKAEKFIQGYEWPGNVKELKSSIQRACAFSKGEVIEKNDLLPKGPDTVSIKDFLEGRLKKYLKEMATLERSNLHDLVLSEVEKALIEIVLKETGGNQLKATKALGMNRNTLRAKIKKYKLGAV